MTADILTRLQQATGPDTALDDAICIALQYAGKDAPNPQDVRVDPDDLGWLLYEMDGEAYCDSTPSLTESIDASLALVERKLPGKHILIGKGQTELTKPWARIGSWSGCDAVAETLPLAILVALFSVLEAGEVKNDRE